MEEGQLDAHRAGQETLLWMQREHRAGSKLTQKLNQVCVCVLCECVCVCCVCVCVLCVCVCVCCVCVCVCVHAVREHKRVRLLKDNAQLGLWYVVECWDFP